MAGAVALALKISADTKGAVQEIDKVSGSLNKSQKTVDSTQKKYATLGKGALVAGGTILAGFGLAAKATIGFDKAMSNVGAAADVGGKKLDNLRQAALQAGKDTSFSASQAADAEAELAKAGVSTSDILGGALKGSLSLAAAGQIDLAEAATISAQAMSQFNLRGKDVGHIADVLAAGANKSATDISGLGLALQQGGLVAKQTGLSLEDTVGVLALFGQNALIGSDAGTSLKTMLQRLTPTSKEAADKMHELGISAYDSQGNFVGLEKFAGILRQSLSRLTPEARNAALATIFGSDATRAASIIYDAGAKGVHKWTAAVNDQGAASDTASKKMDNLAGDIERLRGSVETGLIGAGSNATSILRFLVQGADDAVQSISDLPDPIQKVIVTLAGVGGAALTAVGAFSQVATTLNQGKQFFDSYSASAGNATGATGKFAGALKIAGTAAAGLGIAVAARAATDALYDLIPSSEDARKAIVKFGGDGQQSVDEFAKAVKRDVNPSLFDIGDPTKWLGDIKKGFKNLTDSSGQLADTVKKQFDEIAKASPSVAQNLLDSLKKDAGSQKDIGGTFRELQKSIDDQVKARGRLAVASQRDAELTQQSAAAQSQANGKTREAAGLIGLQSQAEKELQSAIEARINATISSFSSDLQAIQATKTLAESIKGNEDPLTIQSNLLSAAGASASAMADQFESANGVTATAEQKANFYKLALAQLGGQFPSLQGLIAGYIAKLNAIPPSKHTDVTVSVSTGNAQAVVDSFIRNNSGRTIGIRLSGNEGIVTKGRRSASGGEVPGFGAGGKAWPGMSWVGEKGKELAVFPQGARILSHEDSMRAVTAASTRFISTSGGGNTYQIRVEVAAGAHPAEVGAGVVNVIKAFEKANGKSWRNN